MLEFNPDKHEYRLDGVVIPSVSEILRFCFREVYEEVNSFLMDQAADRGTRVHKACEELDKAGTTECDPDIEGYVEAYTNFLKDHKVNWTMVEEMIHKDNEYAGTLDRFGLVDGKPTLMDIKTTGSITKKHKLLYGAQLTGYRNAVISKKAFDATDYSVLQLKSTGSYSIVPLECQPEVWESCLTLHTQFEKTKRRKK